MRILHALLAGAPTQTSWSQAYVKKDDDSFFGVVIHVSVPITEREHVGKSILDACMNASQDGMTRDVFLNLFKQWGSEGIHIASVCVSHDKMTLFAQGQTNIWLERGGKGDTVLKGKAQGVYIEGNVFQGDYYCISTSAYASHFGTPDVHLLPQDACDNALSKLAGMNDGADVCALFLQASSQEKVMLPPVESVPKKLIHPSPLAFVHRSEKTKKILKIAGGIIAGIVLLMGVSIFLTVQKQQSIMKALNPYQQRYATLTQMGSDKRTEESQGLRELSRDITAAEKTSKDSSLTRALDTLLVDVNKTFENVSGEKHIDKLDIFYDFRLIAADFVANSEAYDVLGKRVVFLDSPHSRLLSLSLEKKETQTLSVGDSLQSPVALAVADQNAYVLGDNGVMELSLPLDKIGSVVVVKDAAWQTPKFVNTFGTNTYILDTGVRNLLKYDLTNASASPSAWFTNKSGLDFTTITSLRIDGGVWLGTNTGKIFHFTQGAPSSFSYKGVLDPPTSTVYVYTSVDSQKLYVLDPHGEQLLVLGKDGTYQSAVVSPDLGTATGVIVDETTNTAYILSGSLVYDVGL